jgi:hypothetical protein
VMMGPLDMIAVVFIFFYLSILSLVQLNLRQLSVNFSIFCCCLMFLAL